MTLEITDKVVETSRIKSKNSAIATLNIGEFLRSVQTSAYRMARLSTGNREDALDLVQDSMTRLVEKYRDKAATEWRPLFYAILSSRLTDWHRKRAFRSQFQRFFGLQENSKEVLESLSDDFALSQEQWLTSHRDMARVLSVIEQLSERQRQVFLLRQWQGFSVAETAEILGCSSGSVKTHLHRANQAIIDLTGDHHE